MIRNRKIQFEFGWSRKRHQPSDFIAYAQNTRMQRIEIFEFTALEILVAILNQFSQNLAQYDRRPENTVQSSVGYQTEFIF
jgi:hypothetical protein